MTLTQPSCAVVRRGRWAPWRGSPRWRGAVRYPKRRASSGRRLAGCDWRPGLPPCLARADDRDTRNKGQMSEQCRQPGALMIILHTPSRLPLLARRSPPYLPPRRKRIVRMLLRSLAGSGAFLLRVQQSGPARGRNKFVGICGRRVSSGYSPSNGRLARAPPLPLTQESLVSILAWIVPGVSGRSGQRTALQCPR
jgi:hypothetical protein